MKRENILKIFKDFKDPYATYLNVTFSIRPPEDVYRDIFLVGAFNDWLLSDDYKLRAEEGIYSLTIPLKRGIYDYQYVVADEINSSIFNPDWLVLEGNTWNNKKVYAQPLRNHFASLPRSILYGP